MVSNRLVRAKLALLGAVEGYYASEVIIGLIRCGLLEQLIAPCKVEALARPLGISPRLLDQTLDFLARTTELVERVGTSQYRLGNIPYAEIVFQFEKFIGAYGGSVRGLSAVLHGQPNKNSINETALAAAFAAVGTVSSKVARQLQRQGCRRLLDLGCGPASLPIEMALADDQFEGICLDSSDAMCRLARSRIRAFGVASRVRVYRADVRNVREVLDAHQRRRVEALHGRSLINAFFGHGHDAARAFLRKLRGAFPGRTAFFVDYYGELGSASPPRAKFRLAQVHDLAQLASGQGVPPPDHQGWRALYRQSGCELICAFEFRSDDIRWFIHEVRLSP